MSRITTGLLTNSGDTTMKKRMKKADGGMAEDGRMAAAQAANRPRPDMDNRGGDGGRGRNAPGFVPPGLQRQLPAQANPQAAAARSAAMARFAPPAPAANTPVATPGGSGGVAPLPGGAAPMTGGPMPVALKKGGAVKKKAKGGAIEGSAKDTREDKAMAKKRGMTMAQWENSAADVEHDMPMKKRGGGIAQRGKGVALRGGGIAVRGMGAALKKGGMAKKRGC